MDGMETIVSMMIQEGYGRMKENELIISESSDMLSFTEGNKLELRVV